MKRILFSLMAVVLCLGLMGGAFAYFSDVEESTGNTFTAGTIDLKMNDENPRVSAIFTFPDIKPCEDLEAIVIKLENVGQNNGYLYQKIDYVNKDKDAGTPESDPYGPITANEFAALIYVKSITYQHFAPGYTGTPREDLSGMVAAMDSNKDGYVSLYEMKNFGWMPYSSVYPEPYPYDPGPGEDPAPHTLKAGETATWTIVFHMADSLEGRTWGSGLPTEPIEVGVEDNAPQADGIELTWTAILRQNPASVNPLANPPLP